jgi:ATP-binding cassette, subfamily B, bacterial
LLPALRHGNISERLFKQREDMYRSATRISLLTGLVTGTTLALAYRFVAVQGVAGTINPGGGVLVIGAFTAVSGTLGQISSTFVAVDQHTTFLEDYFSFLAIGPLIPVVPGPARDPTVAGGRKRVRQCRLHLRRWLRAGGGRPEPAHSKW